MENKLKTPLLYLSVAILIVVFIALVLPTKVYAANFKLDKTRIVLDDSTRRDEIRIYNEADILQSFKVTLIEMEMNEEGSLVPVDSYEKSAQPYLRVGPRISRDVKPYTFQKVRIIKKKTPEPGEYRSHLLVEALTQEPVKQVSGIFIRPNIKYVIPIFVIQGEERAELEFGTPITDEEGKLKLVINRRGTGSVSGNIIINDKNDEELFRANQISIYPELNSRSVITSLNHKDLLGQPVSLLFENHQNEIITQQVIRF